MGICIGVEILYVKSRIEQKPKNPKKPRCFSTDIERYRVEDKSLNNMKDLMKKEIDNIDKKINFDNVISVKFTG